MLNLLFWKFGCVGWYMMNILFFNIIKLSLKIQYNNDVLGVRLCFKYLVEIKKCFGWPKCQPWI